VPRLSGHHGWTVIARQRAEQYGRKPAPGEESESDRPKARRGAALIERNRQNEKIAIPEAGGPFGASRPSQRDRLASSAGLAYDFEQIVW
jgi:hypothetical protein